MKANRLQLNPAKTEVLWCASSRRQHQIPTGPVRVGDALVSPVTAARDLGVYFDAGVTMKTQVINTVRACFAELCQICSMRRALPHYALLTLIRTLVITKLDQCKLVLVGTSVYLQDRLPCSPAVRAECRRSACLLTPDVRTHNSTATGGSLVMRPGTNPVLVVCSGVPLCAWHST